MGQSFANGKKWFHLMTKIVKRGSSLPGVKAFMSFYYKIFVLFCVLVR